MTSRDTVLAGPYQSISWDLHPDGDRLVAPKMINLGAEAIAAAAMDPERFLVVVNWFEELRQRMGSN